MGKLYLLISALLIAVGQAVASTPSGYEWWFDNDVSTAQTGSVSGEQFDIQIDLSDLPKGTHYFNCRLNTADGEWGSVYRKMFYSVDNTVGAISYEYWFDNDYASKVSGDISAGSLSFEVDASPLTPGTHYFNCRLYTNQGGWGATYRKMVFTTGSSMDVVAYEYWIDDNYSAKVEGSVSQGTNVYTVNTAGVRKGLHRFNYRLRTGGGEWGSVYSKYFFCTSPKSPFTTYEYWLDNDYANRKSATTDTNPTTFEIDLNGFDKSGEAHYFNLRVRDDDGDWSSFYRKLLVFYKDESKAPVIGYRHSFNGVSLGFVPVERRITDSYTFDFDIPDSLGFKLRELTPKFESNKVTVEAKDSIHYMLQIQTELGWAAPTTYDFESNTAFSTDAVEMAINSSHSFAKPARLEFAAIKFTSVGEPLYFRSDGPIALDLYHNGEKVEEIAATDLAAMTTLTLEAGEYFGVLRDAEYKGDSNFTFHLMDTPNMVPTPKIEFANGIVTITCTREGADIYYTLDDSTPTVESNKYAEPFALEHNAVVKAMAIVPGSDIAPSAIGELVVDSYTVSDPQIRFENLMVVITQEQREGVQTYYTLDGKEPVPGEANTSLYGAPFSLTGSVKVLARSFKEGYNPSAVVEFAYNHSVYITAPPTFSVEGNTVTLTATTEGSDIYYSIGDPDPDAMAAYEAPFEMSGNGTIYAQARKSGMYDSEVVSYEVNGKKMGRPQITYDAQSHMVTITAPNSPAEIYYTLDGSAPAPGSETTSLYDAPFEFDRNGVVKAIAIDPTENLDPSDIAERVIDENTVKEPQIRFENLMVVITQEQREGVQTYYTLDGKEPVPGEANTSLYGAPFSLTGSVKVLARSFKEGYNPSAVVEFAYNHSVYITAPPTFSVEGNTVTLTATTEGSDIYYSIGDPDPDTMAAYEAPFEMSGNGTIYAQARKSGMYDSEVVSYEVNGKKMGRPQITYDAQSHMVTITAPNSPAEIYYTLDGSAPAPGSETTSLYDAPFEFDRNGVVKAIATDPTENLDPSDIAERVIDENTVKEPQIRFENLMVVITQEQREGVQTYYTLDGKEPVPGEANTSLYGAPFSLTGSVKVLARSFKEGYNPSAVVEFAYNHSVYITAPPTFSVEGNTVTLTATTEGSEIYYSIGDPDPDTMAAYEAPFEMSGNGTIYAQARKSGMYDSEVVSYEVNGKKMGRPQITYDAQSHMVTITAPNSPAEIYYTLDGSAPAPGSDSTALYDAPFEFDRNGVVKAIAIDPTGNLDPSDIAELVIDENTVKEPQIRFENLMVVITQEQREGVQTYYTLDGKEPVPGEANTSLYSAPFSLTGSVKVLARSFKEGYNPSAVVEFAYNHSVYITAPPAFKVEGNTVTLTATTEGSEIYYSIGDPDPDTMVAYEAPFEMSGNGTIYAQARKSGMYDSEVVSYEVNGKKMVKPQIAYDAQSHMVTITAPNSSAEVYYTLDGSAPVPGSDSTMLYDGPFEFDRNGVVKAIAIDPTGNLDPSDIAERVIDENTVKDPQIRFENLMVVITQEQREGVQTYYTLDGKEPVPGEANTSLYSAPFSLTGSVKVLARSFKEGYNPSAVVEFAYNHSVYVTAPPTFKVEGNTVTLTATTEGSDIYYSIGDPDPDAMVLYTGSFTVSGNMTVYAQARKSGMYDSEVVSHAMIGQKTMMPYGNFDSATRLLTLRCDTDGAVISYAYSADGDWEVYSSPILIEGNRTVYAKASAPDYLDSEIAEIVISDFKCVDVNISYNGRYVTLSTNESDAEIRYTLNGENPAGGTAYTGAFDAEGLGTVKAVVVKSGYMNSDIAEYAIRGYADEEHAETAVEGILESCYEWAGRDWLDGVDRLRIEGHFNGDDYALLREMKSLRHLDLTDVEHAILPDAAFSATKLVSVAMPKQIAEYGTALFNGNEDLCAIVWNSVDVKADSRLTEGVTNPNLLLYLPYADATNATAVRNKIESGTAAGILLADGYPYYAPLDFTADRISYTRSFSKQTQIGICAGWETLTLPFDVEEVKDALGEVKPFEVAGDDDRPFWLYRPDGTGWAKTGTIRAHMPYLISMPNNPDYVEEYNIRGDVTFSAAGASVAATPDPAGFSYKGTVEMWPNYSRLAAADNLWVVNDDWSEGNPPGSVFEQGLRDVRPFECYVTSDVAKRRMPIFDSSEVDEVMSELGTKIWCENHDLCIMSGISRRIRIYDTVGQMIRVAEVRAGEICRVHDLAPGIYLIGHTKYMVR